MRRALAAALAVAGVAACRGKAPGVADAPAVRATVDSLIPLVEKAVGITFKKPPRFEMRTKAQVQEYLRVKLEQEFPASKMTGVEAAYRLLELLPDTVDIKSLLLPLYSEQVAGYYDPDSTTLYAVEGAKGDQLRLVLAHELVHALQHERLPLEKCSRTSPTPIASPPLRRYSKDTPRWPCSVSSCRIWRPWLIRASGAPTGTK